MWWKSDFLRIKTITFLYCVSKFAFWVFLNAMNYRCSFVCKKSPKHPPLLLELQFLQIIVLFRAIIYHDQQIQHWMMKKSRRYITHAKCSFCYILWCFRLITETGYLVMKHQPSKEQLCKIFLVTSKVVKLCWIFLCAT